MPVYRRILFLTGSVARTSGRRVGQLSFCVGIWCPKRNPTAPIAPPRKVLCRTPWSGVPSCRPRFEPVLSVPYPQAHEPLRTRGGASHRGAAPSRHDAHTAADAGWTVHDDDGVEGLKGNPGPHWQLKANCGSALRR